MSVKIHGSSLYEIDSPNGECFTVPYHKVEYLKSRKNDSLQEVHLSSKEVIRVYNNDFEDIKISMKEHASKMDEAFSEEDILIEESSGITALTNKVLDIIHEPAKRRGRPAKVTINSNL